MEKIRSSGAWTQACCPFHSEANPSFKAKAGGEGYFCFSCGKGGKLRWLLVDLGLADRPDDDGDVLDERVRRAMWRAQEAAREAAKKLDVWPEECLKPFRMIEKSRKSAEAFAYLAARGIERPTIYRWGIGYDPWANRIVFPLRSRAGELAGISGRAIYPDAYVKYAHYCFDLETNTPEQYVKDRKVGTYLESKKSLLVYGGHLAQGPAKELIVVEGHLDAVMLDQIGFWSVAIMGSSVSLRQESELEALVGSGKRLVVLMDGDDAGRRGAEKFAGLAKRIPVFLAECQEGLDPATMDARQVTQAIDDSRLQ